MPHLNRCGYSGAHIRSPFSVDKYEIPLAAFAGKPHDNWSACIAAVNLESDSRASAAKVQGLGAPAVFVCGAERIDLWAIGPTGPTTCRTIEWPELGNFFHKHRHELAPSRIYDAKLRRPGTKENQLWFFDAGLMPAVEKNRGETLLRLVNSAIEKLHAELGDKLGNRQAQEDVYRTVFWLLAAKILRDKQVKNFKQLDLTDVEQVFKRIGKHHGETNRLPPFGRSGKAPIEAIAASIAKSGSLADVTSESIAYVYENALIDKAAGGVKRSKNSAPYDIRKELGIHSTPSVLIHHMLAQMWPMIAEIKPEERHVFEPACGHAPFLTASMRWLRDGGNGDSSIASHDYLRNHLHGLEADGFALELAKLALTIADEPFGNSWKLIKGDMFAPGALAKSAHQCRVLLSNPPYEPFGETARRKYEKLGERVSANTKATEMLFRTLPQLPQGSVFGVVMPVGFLHDKESKAVRELMLSEFELSEIAVFSDNLFEHGDHETAVVIGRRRNGLSRQFSFHYRRVREPGMEDFKRRQEFSWERLVLSTRFRESVEFDLRLPELDEVWTFLEDSPKLSQIATTGQGLTHKGKALPEGSWTIGDESQPEGALGFARVDRELFIYATPKLFKLNLDPRAIIAFRSGKPTGKPQVVLNYSPVSRGPWQLKATLDEYGLALTGRFSAVRPRMDGPTPLVLWAILNSPVANAFSYCHSTKRHVLSGTLSRMPMPTGWETSSGDIERAALRYRQLATFSDDQLFSDSSRNEKVQQALRAMDAAVLRAYDLPPRLERQLLDLFAGVERKGVGCEFNGYYPPGFNSFLPLSFINSDQFERSRADMTVQRFKPGESEYVCEVLRQAVGSAEDD